MTPDHVTHFITVRIIYFTRDYTPHDRRFLSALAETEHQVYYLRLERRGHALEDRPLPAGIEAIQWEGGCRPARLSDGPRLLAGLRRVIRQVRPDLIQAGPIQTCAFLTALAGFHPLVSTSWGSDLLLDADRDARYRWATRFTLLRSDALVGDCDTVRRKAIACGMRAERIVAFPWGVDLNHFRPERSIFPGEPPTTVPEAKTFTLLSTRGWEPVYGVDVIARAFVQAADRLKELGGPELRLLMLGNGSQAGLLRGIFQRGGVLDQVFFPGQVSYADLPRYYHSANLYLSASHSDGSSISLLEALACGRPALVSDIPGNREWIEPGVQGWWFPDGDAGALAEGILQSASVGEARLDEMGQAARRLAEARADWDQNFQLLLKAYDLAVRNG